jgi:hypothetical protein
VGKLYLGRGRQRLHALRLETKALIPFLGGFMMMAMSCFAPALTMTLASIAIMFAVWWLIKQGY